MILAFYYYLFNNNTFKFNKPFFIIISIFFPAPICALNKFKIIYRVFSLLIFGLYIYFLKFIILSNSLIIMTESMWYCKTFLFLGLKLENQRSSY